jgi:hypothetical protein
MNKLLVFLAFVCLLACKPKKEDSIPENILPKEKMIPVLADVQVLESLMSLNMLQVSDVSKDTVLFYDIFKNNNITKKQYDESMIFYKDHPLLLNEIYDSVLVRLSDKKDALMKKK